MNKPRSPQGPSEQLLAIAIFFVGGLVIACLIAPMLWQLILTVQPDIRWPFPRVWRRIAMLVALVALFFLRAPLQLGEVPRLLRSESRRNKLIRFAGGAFLTFITAAAAIPLVLATSNLEISDLTAPEVTWRVFRSIPGAILGSFLEESLFRAAIFCGLARHLRFVSAAAISSFLYATIHFMTPPNGFTISGSSPLEGISILQAVVGNLLRPGLVPVLFGLFLVGFVLCFAISRSDSLSLSIGLHVGWFLAAKLAVFVSWSPDGGSDYERFILLAHPWSWASMLLTFGILVFFFGRRAHPDNSSRATPSTD